MQRVDMSKSEAPEGYGNVVEGPKPRIAAVRQKLAEATPLEPTERDDDTGSDPETVQEAREKPAAAPREEPVRSSEPAARKNYLPMKRPALPSGLPRMKAFGPQTWASVLSIVWIIGGLALVGGLQISGQLAGFNIADWIVLILGLAAPVALLTLILEVTKRAGDMRRAALFLGRVAQRLLEPDQTVAKEMGTIGASIRAEIDQVTHSLEQAVRRVGTLEAIIQEQSKSLDQTTNRLDERARSVGTLLDSQRAKIDTAAKGLSVEARVIAETIDSNAGAITTATTKAAEQLKSVQASLDERTRALDSAAIHAVRRTHDATKGLDEQSKRLENITESALEKVDKITAKYALQHRALSEAAADLSRENAQLDKVLENQQRMLARMAEAIEAQAKGIESTIQNCVGDLGMAMDGADQKSVEISDGFMARIERITRAGELASQAVSKAAEAAREASDKTANSIDAQSSIARDALDTHLQEARQALSDLSAESSHTIGQQSDATAEELNAHLLRIREQIETQIVQARETFDSLEGDLGGALSRNIRIIDNALTEAEGRLETIAERVSEKISRLTGETAQSVEDLKVAAEELGSRLANLPDQAGESTAKIRSAIDDQIAEINRIAEGAVDKARSLTQTVEEERERMMTAPLLNDARGIEDRTSGLTEEPSSREAHAQIWEDQDTHQPQRGPRRPAQISSADEIARRIVPRLKPIEDEATAGPMRIAGESNENRLRELREAERRATKPASEGLGWREILQKADAASAADKAERALQAERSAQTPQDSDDKARASLRVVESLQAMAIDLDRALEEDPPADLLQRYLNGERNVFARRLTMLGGPELADRIRNKFDIEPEFRHDVKRYIGEFESLLDTVTKGDRENILAETYLTSQTGKVYLMLINAIGHQP